MSRHASYLLFHAADRRYALAVSDVLRVVPAAEPTPVRNMPPAVHGVINVAGDILPVIDIRVQDGGKVESIEPSDHFILTRAAGLPLALLVAGVDGVEELEEIAVTLPMEAVSPREAQTPGQPQTTGEHVPDTLPDQDPAQFADLDDRPGTALVATLDGEIVLIQNIRRFIAAIAQVASSAASHAVSPAVKPESETEAEPLP